jgi:predicted ATPase
MLLRSMFAQNYRSLRSIHMDLPGTALFLGENGVGKSNLDRVLKAAAPMSRVSICCGCGHGRAR